MPGTTFCRVTVPPALQSAGEITQSPAEAPLRLMGVPVQDGSQATATRYAVRIRYSVVGGTANSGLRGRLVALNGRTEQAAATFEDRTAATPGVGTATLTGYVDVGGGEAINRLGLALGKTGSGATVTVHDVSVLETRYPDHDIDF